MTRWRGQPLTHEMAEQLFIGWMSSGPQLPDGTGQEQLKPYSWLVAAGKNPVGCGFAGGHGKVVPLAVGDYMRVVQVARMHLWTESFSFWTKAGRGRNEAAFCLLW
jgi:hypothetical protein